MRTTELFFFPFSRFTANGGLYQNTVCLCHAGTDEGAGREEIEGKQANGWHQVSLVEWHSRRDEGQWKAT